MCSPAFGLFVAGIGASSKYGALDGAAAAEVDPAIRDAIKKVKPSDYPSANAVTVLGTQHVVYQADGQFANTIAADVQFFDKLSFRIPDTLNLFAFQAQRFSKRRHNALGCANRRAGIFLLDMLNKCRVLLQPIRLKIVFLFIKQ